MTPKVSSLSPEYIIKGIDIAINLDYIINWRDIRTDVTAKNVNVNRYLLNWTEIRWIFYLIQHDCKTRWILHEAGRRTPSFSENKYTRGRWIIISQLSSFIVNTLVTVEWWCPENSICSTGERWNADGKWEGWIYSLVLWPKNAFIIIISLI